MRLSKSAQQYQQAGAAVEDSLTVETAETLARATCASVPDSPSGVAMPLLWDGDQV